jgi:hypothetical protein
MQIWTSFLSKTWTGFLKNLDRFFEHHTCKIIQTGGIMGHSIHPMHTLLKGSGYVVGKEGVFPQNLPRG